MEETRRRKEMEKDCCDLLLRAKIIKVHLENPLVKTITKCTAAANCPWKKSHRSQWNAFPLELASYNICQLAGGNTVVEFTKHIQYLAISHGSCLELKKNAMAISSRLTEGSHCSHSLNKRLLTRDLLQGSHLVCAERSMFGSHLVFGSGTRSDILQQLLGSLRTVS